MESTVQSEFAEEEELISSSTRYLNGSLSLNNLKYLQALEVGHAATVAAKLTHFLKVVFHSLFTATGGFYSEFERLVLASEPNDCSLVAKYSKIESFGPVSLNSIAFPHPLRAHLDKLTTSDQSTKREIVAKIDSTPLVVFVHGLGGQASQFEQMIAILSQCSDIYTVDLPGFGNSAARKRPGCTLTEQDPHLRAQMVRQLKAQDQEFWKTDRLSALLAEIVDSKRHGRKVILIGHSMGTHLCVKIANLLPHGVVAAMVLLSPPKIEAALSKKRLGVLTHFPRLFDVMRVWDRIGGLESHSVRRQIFGDAPFKRLKQLRWNLDVDSTVVLKYVKGFSACTEAELLGAVSSIGDSSRVLVMCGKDDRVTPCAHAQDIAAKIGSPLELLDRCGHALMLDKPETSSGLVYKFMESLPDLNINLGWCLQIRALISGDKWGLKNELKWKSLSGVSNPIVNRKTGAVAPLVSMKTLRESDPVHSPAKFEEQHQDVAAIIDISSDLASYNPANFRRIKYHKMATVSKFIPDADSVRKFITLVDEIRAEVDDPEKKIAVHCHYGFNRTGYLICCYLIEQLGWDIDDVVLAFKAAREPGIKHPHFIDGLYVKYK